MFAAVQLDDTTRGAGDTSTGLAFQTWTTTCSNSCIYEVLQEKNWAFF
jgi:hypothetical protein